MVDVVPADAVQPEAEEETPAPSGPLSPLGRLRGKRQELDKTLHLDLPVPRWDETLGFRMWVRFKPADPSVIATSIEKRERSHRASLDKGSTGDPHRMVKANADLLVDACVAIYGLALDEEPPKGELPPGDYPTFGSPDLAEELGLATRNAVDTARQFYATDGDLQLAAAKLLDWSATASDQADADFLAS